MLIKYCLLLRHSNRQETGVSVSKSSLGLLPSTTYTPISLAVALKASKDCCNEHSGSSHYSARKAYFYEVLAQNHWFLSIALKALPKLN